MSIGRNEKCHCESGKKFKKCCINNYTATPSNMGTIKKDKYNNFIDQYSKRFNNINSYRELNEAVEFRRGQFTSAEIERLKERGDGKIDEIIQEEFMNDIINPFVETLPEEVKKIIKQVNVIILPTFEINASAIKSPNGEYFVILHQQLMTALSHYNEAQMIFGLLMKLYPIEKAQSFMIEAYKEIIKCSKYKNYLPKFSQLPPFLPRDLYLLSMEKTFIQELFLVAHEFAHIYLGHLSESNEKRSIEFQGEENEEFVKSQMQELEADTLAFKWIINAFKKKKLTLISSSVNTYAPYYAIEVFMFLHMIEVNTDRYADYQKSASLNKELTLIEITERIVSLTYQLDQLVKGNLVGQKLKHPYASLRMVNAIANTRLDFDEKERDDLLEMIRNMAYYETFLVEQF